VVTVTDRLVIGSLLYYLDPADREFLLSRATILTRVAGRTLMYEGDPTNYVLVLLSGWVRVYTNQRDGTVVLYSLCGPGEVIGDLAALQGEPRSASVDTLHETEFAQFTHESFLACLHDRATISVAMLRQMATRLRNADGVRVGFATMDVAQRVAAFLVRLADQHGRQTPEGVLIGMPLTQQDVANSIGGSRRAVARALQTFRDRGLLDTGRRTYVLSALDVLRRLAGTAPNGT
jgi:CRP/FNR family transcriptional regulator, cyclic AMP receptor protein